MRFWLAFLATLCFVTGAHAAAPAIDGSSGWTVDCSNATSTLTLGSLTTSNTQDAIIIETGIGSVTHGYILSITDTAGLSWSRRGTATDQVGDWSEEWYAPSAAALTNEIITLHFAQTKPGGSCFAAVAFGISGAAWPTPFDPLWGPNGRVGPGGHLATLTTKGTDDLLLAHYVTTVCSPSGPGAGWTAIISPVGTFNLIEYMQVNTAQTNTTATMTGCGAGNIEMSITDAFVAPDGLLTVEENSKDNTYVVLQTGTASSKDNLYVIAEPAIGVSKLNSYVILNGTPNVLVPPRNGLTIFHAFPP